MPNPVQCSSSTVLASIDAEGDTSGDAERDGNPADHAARGTLEIVRRDPRALWTGARGRIERTWASWCGRDSLGRTAGTSRPAHTTRAGRASGADHGTPSAVRARLRRTARTAFWTGIRRIGRHAVAAKRAAQHQDTPPLFHDRRFFKQEPSRILSEILPGPRFVCIGVGRYLFGFRVGSGGRVYSAHGDGANAGIASGGGSPKTVRGAFGVNPACSTSRTSRS